MARAYQRQAAPTPAAPPPPRPMRCKLLTVHFPRESASVTRSLSPRSRGASAAIGRPRSAAPCRPLLRAITASHTPMALHGGTRSPSLRLRHWIEPSSAGRALSRARRSDLPWTRTATSRAGTGTAHSPSHQNRTCPTRPPKTPLHAPRPRLKRWLTNMRYFGYTPLYVSAAVTWHPPTGRPRTTSLGSAPPADGS